MSKNSKGFFLSETIIVLALVTTAIAFVLPNVMKLYENYVNQTEIYDTPQDLYALKAVYEYLENNVCTECGDDYKNSSKTPYTSDLNFLTDNGCETFDEDFNVNNDYGKMKKGRIFYTGTDLNDAIGDEDGNRIAHNYYYELREIFNDDDFDLQKLYITGYMRTPNSKYYEFNKYLKRLKKSTYDPSSYRLIGVFGTASSERYASIRIPNPGTGNCPSSQ